MPSVTHDEGFELPPYPDSRMWWWVATLSGATGVLAGGAELLFRAVSLDLPMTVAEMVQLAGATLLLDGLAGFVTGVVGGLFAQFVRRKAMRWRRYRTGMTIGTVWLTMFFLAPVVREFWVRDQRSGAAAVVAVIFCTAAMAFFNAGFWFRRTLLGVGPKLGWRILAPAAGVVLAAVGIGIRGPKPPTAPVANPGMPNLVLFSIDTLRRDHVGAYGTLVNTPVMDRLGREGVVYDDAVAPLPETLPSHASMLTGLQAMQHKILSNGGSLPSGITTLAEQLAAGGYRTGAFVSSFAVDSNTGLSQGFQVYDDDFFPYLRGVSQLRASSVLLPILMRVANPADFPFLLERGTPETLRRALAWVDEPSDRPFFLWVHIFDPHSPYEPRDGSAATVDHRAILAQEPGYAYTDEERRVLKDYYRQEAEYSDAQVGVLFDALEQRGRLDPAMFVVIADHGEALGEHGINFTHHGIYDEVVRIPLIVWTNPPQAMSADPTTALHVPEQVNNSDVANTFLEFTRLPLLTGTNSTPLLAHARGMDVGKTGLVLVGREGASLTEGQLCGYRDVKREGPGGTYQAVYVRHQDGKEEAFDVVADPGQLLDIAPENSHLLESGRQAVARCAGATAGPMAAPTDVAECEKLKALGYISGDCK